MTTEQWRLSTSLHGVSAVLRDLVAVHRQQFEVFADPVAVRPLVVLNAHLVAAHQAGDGQRSQRVQARRLPERQLQPLLMVALELHQGGVRADHLELGPEGARHVELVLETHHLLGRLWPAAQRFAVDVVADLNDPVGLVVLRPGPNGAERSMVDVAVVSVPDDQHQLVAAPLSALAVHPLVFGARLAGLGLLRCLTCHSPPPTKKAPQPRGQGAF